MIRPALFLAVGALAALLGARSGHAADPASPLSSAAASGASAAVLQGLDKTTARISTFEAPIGRSVKFGTLIITLRACYKAPPEEPPNTVAFLQIDEVRTEASAASSQRLFSGWMFASSPALSALEHPVYDVTLLDCRTETGSSGKAGGK